MMMSQPTNHTGPVQSDPIASPYVSVHRPHPYGVPPGSEGYQHHVMPYVPGPPQGQPSDLMYQVDAPQSGPAPSQSQSNAETPLDEGDGSPLPSVSTAGNPTGKRKQPDSATSDVLGKKRRQRPPAGGEDGEEGQDQEVGPNGGAKHWTEEEKTRFFTWMLTSDEHWDAFRTRMNTVFRECSAELFPGRKSYTALKSCYHRNLEVFKQIHAFQVFSANHLRHLRTENPNAEQPSVDSMLETARVAGLNVGNLNVKVIDRWYETGWFDLFKRRYHEDPKTGLPTPYYGPPEQSVEAGPPPTAMGVHTAIDPQLTGHPNPDAQPHRFPAPSESSPPPSANAQVPNGAYPYSPSSDYRQAGSSTTHQTLPPPPHQPLPYLRSSNVLPPRILLGTSTPPATHPGKAAAAHHGHTHSPYRSESSSGDQYPVDYQAQTVQALTQLTTVTEALLGVCSSLKELLQQQAEESKARTERLRAEGGGVGSEGKAKEREISIEKVTFATDILKNGPQNDEIKKAAIECLTRYFVRDL